MLKAVIQLTGRVYLAHFFLMKAVFYAVRQKTRPGSRILAGLGLKGCCARERAIKGTPPKPWTSPTTTFKLHTFNQTPVFTKVNRFTAQFTVSKNVSRHLFI